MIWSTSGIGRRMLSSPVWSHHPRSPTRICSGASAHRTWASIRYPKLYPADVWYHLRSRPQEIRSIRITFILSSLFSPARRVRTGYCRMLGFSVNPVRTTWKPRSTSTVTSRRPRQPLSSLISMFQSISSLTTKKYKPRHYPKHIRALLTRKAAIWRSLKNNKTDQLKSKYAQIVSDCKEAITNYDINRETKLLDTNSLGAFYKFVNGKLSNSSGIPPLTDPAGNLLITDYDKSNLLNSYFQSVFTTDNGILPNFPSRFPPDSPSYINDIHITTPNISDKIKKTQNSFCSWPWPNTSHLL